MNSRSAPAVRSRWRSKWCAGCIAVAAFLPAAIPFQGDDALAGGEGDGATDDSAMVCGRWLVDVPSGGDSLTLEIVRNGKLFRIGGDSARSGLAVYKRGTLLVAWGTAHLTGLSLYTVGSKGTLYGQWAFDGGDGSLGSERATGGNLDSGYANYAVSGVDPRTRQVYSGTLNARRLADAYFFEWEFSGQRYHGVGLRTGNRIIVGWGLSGTRFGAGEYEVHDDVVTGRTVGSESSVIRSESWQRVRDASDSSESADSLNVADSLIDDESLNVADSSNAHSSPAAADSSNRADSTDVHRSDSLDEDDLLRIFGTDPEEPK